MSLMMNVLTEGIHYRFPAVNKLFLCALLALTACGTPTTPTRIPYRTPIASPTPSFLGGTKDLNCEEAWDFITPKKNNASVSVFPGGHSQWWVGKFRDGRPFLFASGIYDVNKNDVQFAYRCSPYNQAQQLFEELRGK